ncbi:unnamed protein product, partial [Rotaria magnacalcarata]
EFAFLNSVDSFFALSSIRALFGTNEQKNAAHGSDSAVSAEREIRFFFPNCVVEPIPTGPPATDYLEQNV